MKKTWIAAAIVLVLLPLGIARAAEFASNNNGDIIVPATETHRNFYTAGQSVTVDAATQGDLAAAGQTIIINGNVEKSLFAAGEQVNIRGTVGDHARIAGNHVIISGNVNGDLFAVGQEVTIGKDAVISGGFYAAGSTITINGVVKGEVRVTGSDLIINGTTGAVNAYSKVTVNKNAVINGDFRYKAKDSAIIQTGAKITGATHFTHVQSQVNRFAVFFTFAALVGLIGWLIFGLLIIFLLSKQAQKVLDKALASPAAAAGYGFGVIFLLPIAAIILAITIIGLPISFVLGLVWILLVLFGSVFGRVVLGTLIYKLFAKDKPYAVTWLTLLIGMIAGALIGYIPILGGLVKFVFLLLGVGAFSQVLFGLFRLQAPVTTLDSK